MRPSERIRALCNGHPHAKVAWPHRELHEIAEAVEAIEAEHFTPDGAELPTWKQLAELHHRKLASTEVEIWHPIDEAPTDGTDILLSHEDWRGDIVLGGWHFGAWRERPDHEEAALNPTCWMPLPKGPMTTAYQKQDVETIASLLYEAANPTMRWSYLYPSYNHLHAAVRQRYLEAAARFQDGVAQRKEHSEPDEGRKDAGSTPVAPPPQLNAEQFRHAQFMGGVGDEVWD